MARIVAKCGKCSQNINIGLSSKFKITLAPSIPTRDACMQYQFIRIGARHNIPLDSFVIAWCKQYYFFPDHTKQLAEMSDDGSTVVEKKGRGRPKANGTQAEAKADSKKRGRQPAAKAKESTKSSDDEQAPVAKRGRGRPKGSKKKAAPKAKSGSGEGRGRGRPRKDAVPPKKDAASTEEEQDEDEEEEGSDQ